MEKQNFSKTSTANKKDTEPQKKTSSHSATSEPPIEQQKESSYSATSSLNDKITQKYEEVITKYNKAIAINPNNAISYFQRAFAKNKLGQYKEAIADCDKAIKLQPTNAIAYFQRAFAKNKLEQYKEAIADCDTIIKLQPTNAEAYYQRSIAKKRCGKTEEASLDYNKAIKINPKLKEKIESKEDKVQDKNQLNLQENFEKIKEQYFRLAAEFDNYKKRQSQQLILKEKYATESIAKNLFSVLDSLEIALDHIKEKDNKDNFDEFIKGIDMVHQQFIDVFKQYHIVKIKAMGEPFDPNKHEAVSIMETSQMEENKISAVLKSGYTLHDKIIRPAMVQVTKKKSV